MEREGWVQLFDRKFSVRRNGVQVESAREGWEGAWHFGFERLT
jgi:hypothetical protein